MARESIQRFLEHDHRRLGELMRSYRAAVENGEEDAARHFEEFREALTRHLLWEEEILLPLYERNAGAKGAETVRAIRAEHRDIERAVQDATLRVRLRLPEGVTDVLRLGESIAAHAASEERRLYPELDWAAGADAAHVLRSIEESRGKKKGG